MKKILLLLLCTLVLVACKSDKTTNELNVDDTNSNYEIDMESSDDDGNSIFNTEDNSEDTSDTNEMETDENTSEENIPILGFEGMFQKADDAYSDCECNCLMIQLNTTERVCLDKENNLYITVTYKKTEEHKAAMYFVKAVGNMDALKPIPWDKFDTGKPIATVHSLGKQLKVDWIGFTLNGEIAKDYDDLGKNVADVYVLK
ncbi:hypothetical protein [Mesonia sp. K7]|uniref:hypothetical protein n=1 Tax=Mesonia sp. K7 TaxID=2218606 RepID=UPI000DA99345|nr:hypothetical protein [Mesonia sp. K7]PZD76776.1 hypothetical protein DNG35_10970 [Mesonia sp. K7]